MENDGIVAYLISRSSERQSARMSKITNDGLTRSDTECFISVGPCGSSGRQRVKQRSSLFLLLLSDFLLSVAAPSLSLVLVYGTIYRRALYLLTVAVHIKAATENAVLFLYSYPGLSY